MIPTSLKGACFNCGTPGHKQPVPPPQERAPWALSLMQTIRPLKEGLSPTPKGEGDSQASDGHIQGRLKGPRVPGGSS